MADYVAQALALKALSGGTSDSYTKEETDTLLDGKADVVDGKIPASQLPSYVDDTVEGYFYSGAFYEDAEHTTAITGERGKIYVDLTTNKSYRWTGAIYARVDECPAFGETQGTIYEGNKGKANADNIGTLSSLTTTAKSSLVAAINELNDGKADKSTTYTKTEVNAALAAKANISDLGTASVADTTTSITSGGTGLPTSGTVYTDQQRQDAEIGSLVDRGAKNRLKCDIEYMKENNITWAWSGNTATFTSGSKTLTVTVNTDLSLTVSGSTDSSSAIFTIADITGLADQILFLSGCPQGGNYSTGYALYVVNTSGNTIADDTGIGARVVLINPRYCRLIVRSNNTLSPITFKPMICTPTDYAASSAYQPYVPTNRELYEMILAMQNGGNG